MIQIYVFVEKVYDNLWDCIIQSLYILLIKKVFDTKNFIITIKNFKPKIILFCWNFGNIFDEFEKVNRTIL
jgi:hypothetical protein